jgi:D-inositol-3-phosphate glycosyltransferase
VAERIPPSVPSPAPWPAPDWRPRRVAMLTLHTSPTASLGLSANGGLNVYVRELCQVLSRRGVATDVFTRCPDGGCPRTEPLASLSRVVYLPAGPPDVDKYRLLDQVPAFTDHVEDFIRDSGLEYDLMYSHYWLSGLTACALRGRLCLPWAHTAHTLAVVKNRQLAPGAAPEPEVRVDLEGEIARCADLLVVSTDAEGDDLRRAYHVAAGRVAVVPPGVDSEAFRPRPRAEARRLVGLPDSRLFVLVGRLEPLKGAEVALRAFGLLTASGRHPEARLLVLGEDSGADGGGERERLRRLSQELGLAGRVEFRGSVPHDRLPVYYAAADACLVPSYSESFGLVGLEAQACGTAVIAANLPGLASVVRDGVTGYLVDGPEPPSYADRMRRLLDDEELVERLGRSARRRAAAFTWERTTELLLERFASLAPARQRGLVL